MLDARGITIRFGGVLAVDDVHLGLNPGAVRGLVGPNGSGKTTLLNGLCGLIGREGRLEVEASTVTAGRPSRARAAGVVRTFQTPQVVDELSCLENVLVAGAHRRASSLGAAWLARRSMARLERERWSAALGALDRFGLGDLAESAASQLTYGQRRWLELARVTYAEPRYVLADEPAAGLNDAETERLAERLRALADDGVGIVLVDHKVDFLSDVCDRVTVLSLGQVVADAGIEEVWELDAVRDAYLGRSRDPA